MVAKRGRAETLKASGLLNEALAAYDAVIADNPGDMIARNGRSCILVALRRYDEALQHLPTGHPDTRQDWIGYHIRGMILLRTGKIDEAIRIFEHGVRENPWLADREYFRTALAVAYLRRRDFVEAGRILDEVKMLSLQPQANLLRLYSAGASGDTERASLAYQNLTDKPWSISDELVAELHRRYILKEEPRHDDEWFFDQASSLQESSVQEFSIQESRMTLLIASQQQTPLVY